MCAQDYLKTADHVKLHCHEHFLELGDCIIAAVNFKQV